MTDRVKMEIIWEVAELNFRFELQSLNAYLTSVGSSSVLETSTEEVALLDCFPLNPDQCFLFSVSPERTHEGLATRTVSERGAFGLALRKVMLQWSNVNKGPLMQELTTMSPSEAQLGELEKGVALIYSTVF